MRKNYPIRSTEDEWVSFVLGDIGEERAKKSEMDQVKKIGRKRRNWVQVGDNASFKLPRSLGWSSGERFQRSFPKSVAGGGR
jgi:hypothetical protein